MTKINWFNTLNEALASEDLIESFPFDAAAMSYNSEFHYTFDNGTKYGHFVSLTRDSRGMYERPIHYNR